MTNEVFGRPINGDIPKVAPATQQDDPKLFMEALDLLLAQPEVEAVRWEGFTPSFNDGDPCVFGVSEPSVKLKGIHDGGDYGDGFEDGFGLKYHSDQGYDKVKHLSSDGSSDFTYQGVDMTYIYPLLHSFADTLESGGHFEFLREHFGDPSQVTASREGFDVEYTETY